jgi:hypothetical protein
MIIARAILRRTLPVLLRALVAFAGFFFSGATSVCVAVVAAWGGPPAALVAAALAGVAWAAAQPRSPPLSSALRNAAAAGSVAALFCTLTGPEWLTWVGERSPASSVLLPPLFVSLPSVLPLILRALVFAALASAATASVAPAVTVGMTLALDSVYACIGGAVSPATASVSALGGAEVSSSTTGRIGGGGGGSVRSRARAARPSQASASASSADAEDPGRPLLHAPPQSPSGGSPVPLLSPALPPPSPTALVAFGAAVGFLLAMSGLGEGAATWTTVRLLVFEFLVRILSIVAGVVGVGWAVLGARGGT